MRQGGRAGDRRAGCEQCAGCTGARRNSGSPKGHGPGSDHRVRARTPDHADGLVDRSALGRLKGTLVILMGVTHVAKSSELLMRAGRNAATPVLVVQDAATRFQRVRRSTLADLAQDCATHRVVPPAVFVIGPTAGWRYPGHLPRPKPHTCACPNDVVRDCVIEGGACWPGGSAWGGHLSALRSETRPAMARWVWS
ncbi:SAM-dependent methyltransferase [Streptomyces sp. NBC_01386]|uniref:SAM-dependent methyltransferase n=1 Tax=Streptomyces sp. NBC_01386 TaxID=2903848 RepID=UPI003869F36A